MTTSHAQEIYDHSPSYLGALKFLYYSSDILQIVTNCYH